jgi:hypothetical protein
MLGILRHNFIYHLAVHVTELLSVFGKPRDRYIDMSSKMTESVDCNVDTLQSVLWLDPIIFRALLNNAEGINSLDTDRAFLVLVTYKGTVHLRRNRASLIIIFLVCFVSE